MIILCNYDVRTTCDSINDRNFQLFPYYRKVMKYCNHKPVKNGAKSWKEPHLNFSFAFNNTTNLVQGVIQALIEALQVEKNHCSSCFHAHFDTIDVPANLKAEQF